MNDAGDVSGLQRRAQLQCNIDNLIPGQSFAAANPVGERVAGDVFHREVQLVEFFVPATVEERHDVPAAEPTHRVNFPHKPLDRATFPGESR